MQSFTVMTTFTALRCGIGDAKYEERARRAIGSFYLALMNGLMARWLLDPKRAPSGRDMAEALGTVLEDIRPAEQATPPSV